MISGKDIEEILITALSQLMPVSSIYVEDDIPDGNVSEERITLHVKDIKTQPIFKKCFVEVNWCVPDIGESPDPVRLKAVEHQMVDFEDTGEYDDTGYRYGVEDICTLKSELKCHYVNTRLLFEILNVK